MAKPPTVMRRLLDMRHAWKGGGSSSDARLTSIEQKLDALLTKVGELTMSIQLAREALAALNATTNTLSEAVTSVVAADQAEDDAFRAEIADLKAQIAAGNPVTEADLNELIEGMGTTKATLEAVAEALSAMGSNPSEPIPPVEIPPVEG